MRDRERERERERQRHRQREEAPRREPDVGLDPRSPASCPGRKAGPKPLSHPGIPSSAHFFIELLFFGVEFDRFFIDFGY